MLYQLASKIKSQIANKLSFLAKYIAEKKLDTTQRLDAGLDYLLNHIEGNVDVSDFEKECGIGIVISPEEIECEVEKVISTHKVEIIEKRYICYIFNINIENLVFILLRIL